MKILGLFLLLLLISCKKNTEPKNIDFQKREISEIQNDIFGKWKLVKSSSFLNASLNLESKNIFYSFSNIKLEISRDNYVESSDTIRLLKDTLGNNPSNTYYRSIIETKYNNQWYFNYELYKIVNDTLQIFPMPIYTADLTTYFLVKK